MKCHDIGLLVLPVAIWKAGGCFLGMPSAEVRRKLAVFYIERSRQELVGWYFDGNVR